MTKYINIFGGPGSGKSVAALDIARQFKIKGLKTELVTEFAKDLVWEQRTKTLDIQPYVTIKQYRNLTRVDQQVDYAITDAPILMGIVYADIYNPTLPKSYAQLIYDLHSQMDTLNIMLEREFAYQSYGRNQDESGAIDIDNRIRSMLERYQIEVIHTKPTKLPDVLEGFVT